MHEDNFHNVSAAKPGSSDESTAKPCRSSWSRRLARRIGDAQSAERGGRQNAISLTGAHLCSAECVKILCEQYKISQAGHHPPSSFQLFLLNFSRLHFMVLRFFMR